MPEAHTIENRSSMSPSARKPETLDLIARSIRFLTLNREQAPSLEAAAAHAGMSPAHFQRVFTAHVGISPKRFLAYLRLEDAKAALSAAPVLDAAYAAGLSGPGRLHDLFVTLEAVTPGEFKAGGRGLSLAYGFAPTPFGSLLCISSVRGIVGLAFADEAAPNGAAPGPTSGAGQDLWACDAALADMRARFPAAGFREDAAPAREAADALFGAPRAGPAKVKLAVTGTNFQVRVWEALVRLPVGATTTYAKLAQEVCGPSAVRAVASAVGRNPVALLIPCHRVLRSDGGLGGYHWGLTRKRALLAWERAALPTSV